MSKKIVVKCSCKKEYTLEEFRKLPFVNYGITDFSTVFGNLLEMRNCPCGSTRSIIVNFMYEYLENENEDLF